jgi:crossover junction endodeoxyribonuclease RuvC
MAPRTSIAATSTLRTAFLNVEGYRVLRFWNKVMGNLEGVVAEIARNLPLELRGSLA